MPRYIVAFRYKATAGAYAGVVTWTSFESKKEFNLWMKSDPVPDREVAAEGITDDEAVALAQTTPLSSRVAVALAKSTDPTTGALDEENLRHQIACLSLLY